MKELSDILKAYTPATDAALATVVRVEGSAYRRPGARMLITGDGRLTGGVSGGCLERDVRQRAGAVITSGNPVLVHYDTSRDEDGGTGYSLGCGGAIDILIESLNTPAGAAMMRWLETSQVEPITVATVISKHHSHLPLGQRIWVHRSGDKQGSVDNELARHALAAHRSQNLELDSYGENVELFVDVLHPPLQLVIFGAGNDALPLIGFARALGWKVTLVDVGSSPLDVGRSWEVDTTIRCRIDEVSRHLLIDESAACVVMTHNFNHDAKLIQWLQNRPLAYLGLLGPRHRTDQLLGDMQMSDLHSPVGLDLGAENPQEVALAIVAEIIAVLHGRSGGKLRQSSGPIQVHSHPIKESECQVAAS